MSDEKKLVDGVQALRGTPYLIDYRKEPLGKGNFGEVRLAYNRLDSSESLCCKISKLKRYQEINQANNEMQKLSMIPKHENLVHSVKLNLTSSDSEYLIMERCKGGDLTQYIEGYDGDIPEEEIANFLQQFIAGYGELHSRGILHCDIKPDNILIHRGVFKISDFGMASILKFKGQQIPAQGNILTRAPELYGDYLDQTRYKSKTEDYSKADMFSLGCLLYLMLYKQECHPYIGFTKDHNNGWTWASFCSFVNRSPKVVFPAKPVRSVQIKELITRLVDKTIATRMSFEELRDDESFCTKIEKQMNISQSQTASRLSLTQNWFLNHSQVVFKSITIQPRLIGSGFMSRDSFNESNSATSCRVSLSVIKEEGFEKESESISLELTQEQMRQFADKVEEILKREDEHSMQTFAILDSAIFHRSIVFFLDKLASHIDTLQLILKKAVSLPNSRDSKKQAEDNINLIHSQLEILKFSLVCLALNLSKKIFSDTLRQEFTDMQLLEFKITEQHDQFEAMRIQDVKSLEAFKEELANSSSILLRKKTQTLDLKVQMLENVFSSFNQMFEILEPFQSTKQLLVVVWYVFQVKKLLQKKSDFDREIKFREDSKFFNRYYHNLEHSIPESLMFTKVVQALENEQHNVILSFDDENSDDD